MSGFIKKRGFLVIRSLLVLTVLFAVGAFVVTAFRPAKASLTPMRLVTATPFGGGTCTSDVTVTGSGGSLAVYRASNSNIGTWFLQHGGSYTASIANVTCTENAITVEYSNNGSNYCFNATRVGISNTFSGSFTYLGTCMTGPVTYSCGADLSCTGQGDFSPKGTCAQAVHFAAGDFTNPSKPTAISCDGGGGSNGCLLPDLPGGALSCNPDPSSYAPDISRVIPTTTGDCQLSEITPNAGTPQNTGGCNWTVTNTYTAYCTNHPEISCETSETFTWSEDHLVFNGVPGDASYQCYGDVPTAAHVTATGCQGTFDAVLHEDASNGTSSCNNTITRYWTATNACNQEERSATQTITVNDTTAPTFTTPSDADLECNPRDLPTCESVKARVTDLADNCGGTPTLNCETDGPSAGDNCVHSQVFTLSATDGCGNTSDPVHVTYTWKESVVSVECPTNLTPLHAGANCKATLPSDFRATKHGCGAVLKYYVGTEEIDIDAYEFPVGTTTVTAKVTGPCNADGVTCTFDVVVLGHICATKFYDANANGVRDSGENGIPGWHIQVLDSAGLQVGNQDTDANGTTCFDLPAGNYTVVEGPGGINWNHSTPSSVPVTVGCVDVSFGNYCRPASLGLTLGFWTNTNGQNRLKNAYVNGGGWAKALNDLNLVKPDGSAFVLLTTNVTTDLSTLKSWLLNATATNMAYMLSAQLATTTLDIMLNGLDPNSGIIIPANMKTQASACVINTINGYVVGTFTDTSRAASCGSGCNAFDGFTTIGQITAEANTILLPPGNKTSVASLLRTQEEALKDVLDVINNNGNPGGSSAYPCGPTPLIYVNAGACPGPYAQIFNPSMSDGIMTNQTNLREWMLSHAPNFHNWLFGAK